MDERNHNNIIIAISIEMLEKNIAISQINL